MSALPWFCFVEADVGLGLERERRGTAAGVDAVAVRAQQRRRRVVRLALAVREEHRAPLDGPLVGTRPSAADSRRRLDDEVHAAARCAMTSTKRSDQPSARSSRAPLEVLVGEVRREVLGVVALRVAPHADDAPHDGRRPARPNTTRLRMMSEVRKLTGSSLLLCPSGVGPLGTASASDARRTLLTLTGGVGADGRSLERPSRCRRSMLAPEMLSANRSRPRGAGPPVFSPTRLYFEPWHGHSNHCEVWHHGTRQPRCTHFWYSAT